MSDTSCGPLWCRGDPSPHRHRHRLPRRHPRRVHGRARLRGRSASTSTRPRSTSSTAGEVPFYEPGLPELLAQGRSTRRPAALHHRPTRRSRRSATCTSSAWAPRRSSGEYAADMTYVDAAVAALAPHLTAARAGRRQVDGAGRHRRAAGRAARRARPGRRRRSSWPGTPSSCARASPSRTPCSPTGSCSASRSPSAPRRCCARSTPPLVAAGTPVVVTDFADRRAGQGRRQRLPGHQDLVHQRDGRGLRGGRRRRHAARRGARPRRPHRRQVPATPASASAAAACPRTSAPSWPAPASSASTRR